MAFGLAYLVAGVFSLVFVVPALRMEPFWPASGVALAAMLSLAPRRWIGFATFIFVVHFVTSYFNHPRWDVTVLLSFANAIEPLIAAWLIKRWVGLHLTFAKLRPTVSLIVASAVAVIVSSVVASFGVRLNSYGEFAIDLPALEFWFVDDFLGIMAVTPIVLAFRPHEAKARRDRMGEALLLLLVVCGIVWVAIEKVDIRHSGEELFWLFPCLIWAALRLSARCLAVIALVMTAAVVFAIIDVYLPVVSREYLRDAIVARQFFLIALLAPTWILHAAYVEKDVAKRNLLEEGHLRNLIMAQASQYVIVCNREGRIIQLSPALEKVLGRRVPVGQPLEFPRGVFDENGEPLAPERWPTFRALRGEVVEQVHARLKTYDDRLIDILISASPLFDAEGHIIGSVSSGTNVTELIRLQRDLDAALRNEQDARAHVELLYEEAVEANRLKDDFLSALSHELRTPMSVILGWLSLLQKRSLTQDKVEHAYTVMERYAQQEIELINDLLDISRMERGHITLSLDELDLNQMVERIAAGFAVVGEKGEVAIDVALAQEPVRVIGDVTRLEQILSNVIANAIKFTPRGGHVRVSVTRPGHDAVIRIQDTGRGIEPGFLPYAFDKFRQENSSAKKEFGGLGLGLAIVKRLVELHHGDVRITSPGIGHGAEVVITLPLSEGLRITPDQPRTT